MDELKRQGDEIQHFTRWNDLVEALSAFAQANAQDVLVEETQKRVKDVDPTKRHEAQEQGRREMENDSLESKEVNKVKGKTNPTFKLASDTEAEIEIKHVTKEVIGGCTTTL